MLSPPEISWNPILELMTLSSCQWSYSSRSTVQACGVWIGCEGRETRRIAPVSRGSNHRRPSRGGGACRRWGLRSCFSLLTESYSQVWWCMLSYPSSPGTPYVASILSSLEAHQSYIFFVLHSLILPSQFLFFLSKHKILKIKEFQLKYLKFLEFKISQF